MTTILAPGGDYALRWGFVAAIALLAASGLHALDVSLDIPSAMTIAADCGKTLLAVLLFAGLRRALPRIAHCMDTPTDLVLSFVQAAVLVQAFLPVAYLAAALGAHFPPIDATLARLDVSLFGYDGLAVDRWLAGHPILQRILRMGYATPITQGAVLLALGSFLAPGKRNSAFIWTAGVSMLLTAGVSIFTPALGVIGPGHADPGYLATLEAIRAGDWHTFSYVDATGLITFPSFHTTLAVLFIYRAAQLHRWALAAFLPVNLVMLASIPPIGGHYAVDMIGGAGVAVAAIALHAALRRAF